MKRFLSLVLSIILVLSANNLVLANGSKNLDVDLITTNTGGYTVKSVASNGKITVAVGEYMDVYFSDDNKNWTKVSIPNAADSYNSLNSVIWDGSQFIAVGDDATVLSSKDGKTWSQTRVKGLDGNIDKIVFNGKKYAAIVNSRYSNGESAIITSADAKTWSIEMLDSGHILTSINWNGKQFGVIGYFFMMGSYGLLAGDYGITYTSNDGAKWIYNKILLPERSYITLHDFVWDGSKYLIAGEGLTGYTEDDLQTLEIMYTSTDLKSFKPLDLDVSMTTIYTIEIVGDKVYYIKDTWTGKNSEYYLASLDSKGSEQVIRLDESLSFSKLINLNNKLHLINIDSGKIVEVDAKQNTSKPATIKATPSQSNVLVNGKKISFEAYSINGNNYFKLRDLAMALKTTEKMFEVGWDNNKKVITLTPNTPYTVVGGELVASTNSSVKEAKISNSTILLDGEEINIIAYSIDSNNYFKLRDISKVLDFGITWDNATKTIGVDTLLPYTE